MSANKTTYTDKNVYEFIDELENEKRRADSRVLVGIFKTVTGFEPRMYGPTIIGFGNYHYKYASGREGDAPIAGFSPRKDSLVLYFEPEFENCEELLSKLGKSKTSKACVYVKRLEDIDLDVLAEMIQNSAEETNRKYPS